MRTAAVIAVVMLGVLASGAGATGGARGSSERELRDFEASVLGPDHAADHAALRRAVRRQALRRAARRQTRSRAGRARGPRARASAVPAIHGSWSLPFAIPALGIHAAMLPTGKVMWFAYPNGNRSVNTATAWLWNPRTRAVKKVDPPDFVDPTDGERKPANIWCSGHAFLPDGRLLVAGGNLAYATAHSDWKGLNKLYTFNPFNETWTEQPDMRRGRWYPTVSVLADGRAVIMSGLDEGGAGQVNPDIELFTPSPDLDGRGTVTLLGTRGGPGQPPLARTYPHTFLMPSGRTLLAGPAARDSWFLHPPGPADAFGWTDAPDSPANRIYGTGVLLPGGTGGSTRVAQIGGFPSFANPYATTVVSIFDEANPAAGWQPGPSLNVARANHNTVLLPDGSMVTVGGGVGSTSTEGLWAATAAHLVAELWNPADGTWSAAAPQLENRSYHSTALLLPDGRVISAGDDYHGGTDRDTAEIYSPPYLFKGARPTITSAPASVSYGATFSVSTPSAVTRAALVAPGATTHATDMNQRYVPLMVTPAIGGVTLAAPASAAIAPPGYYMLFLVSAQGVPSTARFVRLGP